MKMFPPSCEFCGNELNQEPDDSLWRVETKDKILHVMCSYLCCLRYVEYRKRRGL